MTLIGLVIVLSINVACGRGQTAGNYDSPTSSVVYNKEQLVQRGRVTLQSYFRVASVILSLLVALSNEVKEPIVVSRRGYGSDDLGMECEGCVS